MRKAELVHELGTVSRTYRVPSGAGFAGFFGFFSLLLSKDEARIAGKFLGFRV